MKTVTRQEINEAADMYADNLTANLIANPAINALGDRFFSMQTDLMRRAFIHGLLTAFQSQSITYENPFDKAPQSKTN